MKTWCVQNATKKNPLGFNGWRFTPFLIADQFHTTDIHHNKEPSKFNGVTVNSIIDLSRDESDTQSETDSQHIDNKNSEELISSGDPGCSELDSLESQVQALESEMKARFLDTCNLKTFNCFFCSKHFKNESDLRYHERNHHRPKKYTCDICKKAFTRKFNMVTHRQLHFEVRQHTCKFCNKGYTRRDRLFLHYQTSHSSELKISGERTWWQLLTDIAFYFSPDDTLKKKNFFLFVSWKQSEEKKCFSWNSMKTKFHFLFFPVRDSLKGMAVSILEISTPQPL